MLDMQNEHVDAVRHSALRAQLIKMVSHPSLLTSDIAALNASELAELQDVALDLLLNYAPVVEEFLAEESKGIYPITIRGVEGAYFVDAQEYDTEGMFSTIDDAIRCVNENWGEFLVSDEG
jgi:hypothetical protein